MFHLTTPKRDIMGNHNFILIFVGICSLIAFYVTNQIDAYYNHEPPTLVKFYLACIIFFGGMFFPALLAKFIQYIIDRHNNK
jgi:hypothetical protein